MKKNKNKKYNRIDPKKIRVIKIEQSGETRYIVLWEGLEYRKKDRTNEYITHSGLKSCGFNLVDSKLSEDYSDSNADPKISEDTLNDMLVLNSWKFKGDMCLDEYINNILSVELKKLYEMSLGLQGKHYQTCSDIITLLECKLNCISILSLQPNPNSAKQPKRCDLEIARNLVLDNITFIETSSSVGKEYLVVRPALTIKEKNTFPTIINTKNMGQNQYMDFAIKNGIWIEYYEILASRYMTEEELELYQYALSWGHYQTCLDILMSVEERLNRPKKQKYARRRN